ncbi:MAG: glycerophosphodiester phosphodiesterase family protein [Bacteroidaceae bacterium]|nr:glycerophosphodiester phosphodiesterase family protein [Bacteroides sp.]MBQ8242853.1 glycerophosphodiester phosphodiesterase family protein [Bacteroidaceae bacterium]MBQ8601225.1 glycerophosphodiester phosphodiesterase family protein [Bacteroides sp.]
MNKRYCLSLLAVVVCTLQLVAQDRVSVIREKLLNRDESSVIVASHRGDWRNFPENSLAAIDNAIRMGVDIVELDVQRTKDGVLILMHDGTLDRTTTGKGKIAEVTMDSIAKLKLKNGCAIRTVHKVPTLEEALLHAKGKIMLNLDKADRYFEEVYALMQKTGTTKQVIMKGNKSAAAVKKQFGKYLDDVIYMPIVNLDKKNAREQLEIFSEGLNPVAYELLFVKDSNPLPLEVKKMLRGKSLIWYNTLWDTMAGGHDDDMSLQDPDKGYGYLIDTLGCRIIQTDRPQYLIDYLRKRGLHD